MSDVMVCEMCRQPVSHTEFTRQCGMVLHVGCLFRQWQGQKAEIERLSAANEVLSVTLDGLYKQRDECRRLLRELLTIVDHDMSAQFHSDVMDAARKAAGGGDAT